MTEGGAGAVAPAPPSVIEWIMGIISGKILQLNGWPEGPIIRIAKEAADVLWRAGLDRDIGRHPFAGEFEHLLRQGRRGHHGCARGKEETAGNHQLLRFWRPCTGPYQKKPRRAAAGCGARRIFAKQCQ